MVASAEKILNRKPGGLASRRRLGALCALAVQESGQSEKGVYLGRAGMDRFSTIVTRPPLSPAASVVQKSVDCVASLCHDDRQPRFPLRSPQFPRGSKNFVSLWLCGNSNLSGTQPLVNDLYQVPMEIGRKVVVTRKAIANAAGNLGEIGTGPPGGGRNEVTCVMFTHCRTSGQ